MDVTPSELPKLTKTRDKRRLKRRKSKSVTHLQ
jgi:hypothetical protein